MICYIVTKQEWKDEVLNWNPADYGGIEEVNLDSSYVWVPRLLLYNKYDKKLFKQNLFRCRGYGITISWITVTGAFRASSVEGEWLYQFALPTIPLSEVVTPLSEVSQKTKPLIKNYIFYTNSLSFLIEYIINMLCFLGHPVQKTTRYLKQVFCHCKGRFRIDAPVI